MQIFFRAKKSIDVGFGVGATHFDAISMITHHPLNFGISRTSTSE
jgi:hypothetical protein